MLARGGRSICDCTAMSASRTTLLRKGLLIILLPVACQVVLFLILFAQQRRHAEAQQWAVHTQEVIRKLDALIEGLLALQVDLRGQLLGLPAAKHGTLAPTPEEIQARLAALQRLTVDNAAQQRRLAALSESISQRLRWESEVRRLLGENRWKEAHQLFENGGGVKLIGAVREEAEKVRAEEELLERARNENLRDATRWQNYLVIAGLVLVMAVASVSMSLFGRSIARRIGALKTNVERLKRNEPLIEPVHGGDEIGELDASFHEMASDLEDARRRDRHSQQLIERRNGELTRANHELAQKNQENEMFVYSVSHDLRSPLVNLQGFSRELGLVRDDLRAIFDSKMDDAGRTRGRQLIDRDISESIRYIQTAVMRLSTIIDALLRLSRAGRVEYRPQAVEIGPLVRRIVDALRDSIVQRKAAVTVRDLPPVWGDAAALEQIFANLIGNAVNYLDVKRPGKIEIGALPAAETAPETTTYFVRDNGLGIAEAYLPKVFAVFQRLHAKVAPGEGIGLALVRRAAERHGGRIWVQSEEGVGSTFFVSFPREETSPLKLVPRKETLSVRLSSASEIAAAQHEP